MKRGGLGSDVAAMQVVGLELLKSRPIWLKFIFSDQGIAFASPSLQHREISGAGLNYQDEGGNALAGMIVNGGIEIRGHGMLEPERDQVKERWLRVRAAYGDAYLDSLSVSFQGVKIVSV
jgi:hypothetical protein